MSFIKMDAVFTNSENRKTSALHRSLWRRRNKLKKKLKTCYINKSYRVLHMEKHEKVCTKRINSSYQH